MSVQFQSSVMGEIADLLTSQPTLEQVASYQLPESLDARAHVLLEKNREESLSTDEREEMEKYLFVTHLLTLAKAKARLKLNNEN